MNSKISSHNYTIFYILGSGHCGSTLLNLLLNGHSSIIALSEICNVSDYFKNQKFTSDPTQTDFWKKISDQLKKNYNCEIDKIDLSTPNWKTALSWKKEEIKNWALPNKKLLECVTRQSNYPIVVDASKFPQRLYLLKKSEMFDIKVCHLIRDGRAVINSYRRKSFSFRSSFRRWINPSVSAPILRFSLFKKEDWKLVSYERLATSPEKVVKEISNFLDISYEPEMLKFRNHKHFGFGGNRMLKEENDTITLDKRWKKELSITDRWKFTLVGGWLNILYGYSP